MENRIPSESLPTTPKSRTELTAQAWGGAFSFPEAMRAAATDVLPTKPAEGPEPSWLTAGARRTSTSDTLADRPRPARSIRPADADRSRDRVPSTGRPPSRPDASRPGHAPSRPSDGARPDRTIDGPTDRRASGMDVPRPAEAGSRESAGSPGSVPGDDERTESPGDRTGATAGDLKARAESRLARASGAAGTPTESADSRAPGTGPAKAEPAGPSGTRGEANAGAADRTADAREGSSDSRPAAEKPAETQAVAKSAEPAPGQRLFAARAANHAPTAASVEAASAAEGESAKDTVRTAEADATGRRAAPTEPTGTDDRAPSGKSESASSGRRETGGEAKGGWRATPGEGEPIAAKSAARPASSAQAEAAPRAGTVPAPAESSGDSKTTASARAAAGRAGAANTTGSTGRLGAGVEAGRPGTPPNSSSTGSPATGGSVGKPDFAGAPRAARTASAGPPTPNTLPPTIQLQVARGLEAQLAAKARQFLESGRTEIRVNLDPPSLGRLRVTLSLEETRAVARIYASSPEAAVTLGREREELVRAFQAQGFDAVEVRVESEADSSARYRREAGSRADRPQDDTPDRSHDSGEQPSRGRRGSHAAGLDVFA